MKETYWKKYWKIAAAAVFLTAAGLCYGGARLKEGEVFLAEAEASDGMADRDEAAGIAESANREEAAEAAGNGTGSAAEAIDGAKESAGMAGQGNPDQGVSGHGSPDMESQSAEPGYFVHICGEVKEPGVYELPKDSRIFEAIAAAGGFTDEAADDLLNLAEKIFDGMKLVVLSKDEAAALSGEEWLKLSGGSSSGGGQGGADPSGGLVNINTASKEALMTLSGIGESRAEDIIRYREESGGFKKIEDIMKVPGIKNAGFQKIKDSITV